MLSKSETTVEMHRITTRALLEALKRAQRELAHGNATEAETSNSLTINGEFAP